jgi:hypothetical protein
MNRWLPLAVTVLAAIIVGTVIVTVWPPTV